MLILPGEEILIDISKLKNFERPFQNRRIGGMRRAIFFVLSPRLKKDSSKLNLEDSDLQVEMLTKERQYEINKKIPLEEMKALNPKDSKSLKEFMHENEIPYCLVYCKNLWRKTRELKSAGFNLLRSNKHFILCSIGERRQP